jgi:hypothetical protein
MRLKKFTSDEEILECRCCNTSFSEADNVIMYKWEVPTEMPTDFNDIYCYTCHLQPMRQKCRCYSKQEI